MTYLSGLHLLGWKSIRDQLIDFDAINVLIGANGAGKSNLVSFFKLLNEVGAGRLTEYVAQQGGAESLLFFGSKTTASVVADLEYSDTSIAHRFRLVPVPENRLVHLGATSVEDEKEWRQLFSKMRVFHFHDTSASGPLRRECDLHANRFLQSEGGNLPAMLYLYHERHPTAYHRIRAAVRSAAPFFDDFLLEPLRLNPNRINLRWRSVGREYEFGPHQLSDGTLRAIALFTLLLGAEEDRPEMIVLDEPEIGLHPAAVTIFADLVKEASRRSQVVLATQSPTLVDHFEPQDIVAVNCRNGESTFERLNPVRLKDWLEDYTIGELWERNVIGGGPY
jgi:predicted ATPase